MSAFDSIMIDQKMDLEAIEEKATALELLAQELKRQCQNYRRKYSPFYDQLDPEDKDSQPMS